MARQSAPGWRNSIARALGIVQTRRGKVISLLILLIFFLAYPYLNPFVQDSDVDAISNAGYFVVLALGLNVVVGFAGLLDLGYAAFFAIGAYTYGLVASTQFHPAWSANWQLFADIGWVSRFQQVGGDVVAFHFSFWPMLLISMGMAAFFGVLFGAPTLRLRGDYLAIVTLGFGEIVPVAIHNTPAITGGAMGLTGVVAPALFGHSFGVEVKPYYYTILAIVVICIFFTSRLKDSRVGRAWMAIREDELAASCMGVNLVRTKLLAFGIGASLSGLAGAYFAAKVSTAGPDNFQFAVSITVLCMVVLGGMGSIPGVIVGALVLSELQSTWLRQGTDVIQQFGQNIGNQWLATADLSTATYLLFGIALVLMMLFRPEGLIPNARRRAELHAEGATPEDIAHEHETLYDVREENQSESERE